MSPRQQSPQTIPQSRDSASLWETAASRSAAEVIFCFLLPLKAPPGHHAAEEEEASRGSRRDEAGPMRTARALGGGRAWHWSPLCRRQQHRACTGALRCSPVRFLVAESGALSKLGESAAHITAAPCPAPLWVCSLLPTSLSAPPPSSLPPHPGTAAQQPAAMLHPGLGRTRLSLQALPSGLGPGAQGCVTAHKITRGSPRGSASAPAPNPVSQAASAPLGWAPGVVRAVIRRQQGLS